MDPRAPWSYATTPLWLPVENPPKPLPTWYSPPPHNGYVVWRGPSLFDGEPIMVIATGFRERSENSKTGAMIQTWILRRDMSPQEALWQGADSSICGYCPHRGETVQTKIHYVKIPKIRLARRRMRGEHEHRMSDVRWRKSVGRGCYVVVAQAPQTVWFSAGDGLYPELPPERVSATFAKRVVRIGSYGDPAAVPIWVWQNMLSQTDNWTGYTHQWELPEAQEYRHFLMASVDSPQEKARAASLGWRTFRVRSADEPLVAGTEVTCADEMICPASEEGGRTLECEECQLCMGGAKSNKRSIAIVKHGGHLPGKKAKKDPSTGATRGAPPMPPMWNNKLLPEPEGWRPNPYMAENPLPTWQEWSAGRSGQGLSKSSKSHAVPVTARPPVTAPAAYHSGPVPKSLEWAFDYFEAMHGMPPEVDRTNAKQWADAHLRRDNKALWDIFWRSEALMAKRMGDHARSARALEAVNYYRPGAL